MTIEGKSWQTKPEEVDVVDLLVKFDQLLDRVQEMASVNYDHHATFGTHYTPELDLPSPSGIKRTIKLAIFVPAPESPYSPSLAAYVNQYTAGKPVPDVMKAVWIKRHELDSTKPASRGAKAVEVRMDEMAVLAEEYRLIAESYNTSESTELGFGEVFRGRPNAGD